ncbi:hypothetical protein Tco_0470769 [Tanacetum coccineum]
MQSDQLLDTNTMMRFFVINESMAHINLLHTNPQIPITAVQEHMQKQFQVGVSKTKAFRAKAKAENANPNTTVKIDVYRAHNPHENVRRFKRIYVCLGALKYGFRAYGRQLLGLDGAFMKGNYPCQLLTAVSAYANNGIYPVAYGIIDNRDSLVITALECVREYLMKRIVIFQKNDAELFQVNEVACIFNMNDNEMQVGLPEDWIHQSMRLQSWKTVYSFKINPVPGKKRKKSAGEVTEMVKDGTIVAGSGSASASASQPARAYASASASQPARAKQPQRQPKELQVNLQVPLHVYKLKNLFKCLHEEELDSEFSEEEKNLRLSEYSTEIILSQGLPRHIFNNLNQTSTVKGDLGIMWRCMQGSGRTIQQRKEDLFDDYERFRMNTKFVNNLPAYWGKYVTNVKQNMDISTTPYVQIYTHLKAYEPHAKKTLKKQEQSTILNLTLISPNDALMATMTQIANLLSGFQKQFPPTNNQLRTSSNSRTHATVHDGQIVTEPVQRMLLGRCIQERTLDSDAETEIDDNTIPYHQYLLDTEAQNVPTEVSADTSDKVSMIAILTDLQTQLDGHAKVNQEKCLEIETLKNELLQCKQEICRLDTHKVKLDLENKVRQEQALVIQRNKRNGSCRNKQI